MHELGTAVTKTKSGHGVCIEINDARERFPYAVLLDSAMTNCLFAHGLVGMTGQLNIRYHHVVDIGKAARVRAWLECSSHRLHIFRACLEQEDEIKATASGRYLETPLEPKKNGSAHG